MIILGIICLFVSEDNHSMDSENKDVFKYFIITTKEFIISPFTRKLIPFEFFMTFSIYSFFLGWQLYFLNYLKLSESYIGILLVIFMLFMLLGRKLSSIFSNKKVQINKVIVFSFLSITIGFVMMFLFKNVFGFLISAIFIEIGIGLFRNIQEIWLLEIIPSENISSFFAGVGSIEVVFIFILSISMGIIIE